MAIMTTKRKLIITRMVIGWYSAYLILVLSQLRKAHTWHDIGMIGVSISLLVMYYKWNRTLKQKMIAEVEQKLDPIPHLRVTSSVLRTTTLPLHWKRPYR